MWCCCSHFTPLLHTPLNSHDRQMSGIVIITPAILPIRRYRRKKEKKKKRKRKRKEGVIVIVIVVIVVVVVVVVIGSLVVISR